MAIKSTLVLGGGVGGIVASQVIKKALGKDMSVTVVDREDKHYFSASYPMLLIGKKTPQDITRDLKRLNKKGVEFVHAEVKSIDPVKKEVTTDQGTLSCDYMIIALGAEYNPATVPGFAEYACNIYDFKGVVKAAQALSRFQGGHVVLFISSLPFKCPPAPSEIMFLLDQYFRERAIRSKVDLTLVTPESTPEPLAGPLVGQSIRKMMAERGINLRAQAKVLALEPGNLVLDHGNVTGDLFLGIASHRTTQAIRDTNLVDEDGWIKVDLNTLQTVYPDVYAIGDTAAIKLPVMGADAPKAGIFAHYQAEVAARNIALQARGKKPVHRYTGKGV